MENASKALLMAGGVLIAMIIVSLGLYIMQNMAENSAHFYEMMEQSKIVEFNNKFDKYEGKDLENIDEDLVLQDIITLMNLARDFNVKNNLSESDENFIKISGTVKALKPGGPTSTNFVSDLNNILKLDVDENYLYDQRVKDKIRNYVNGNYMNLNTEDDLSLGCTHQKDRKKMFFRCEIVKNNATMLVKEIKVTQYNNWTI